MSLEWITPKTNWAKTDIFAYTDYNRIRNNLLYLNDLLNERYPETAQSLDLGNALAFSSDYSPSQFNAFEDALESFTRVGLDANIGSKKTYKGNDPFIGYGELNRLESCCLRWFDKLDVPYIEHVLPFIFGNAGQISLTISNNKVNINFFGGNQQNRRHYIWHETDNTYENLGDDIPFDFFSGQAVTELLSTERVNGILLMGGGTLGTPNNNIVTWNGSRYISSMRTLPYATQAFSVVLGNISLVSAINPIFIMGGSGNHYSTDNIRAFYMDDRGDMSSWRRLPDLPFDMIDGHAVFVNRTIYAITDNDNKLYEWQNRTTWVQKALLPHKNVGGKLGIVDNSIYYFGGDSSDLNYYKLNNNSFEIVSRLPYPFQYGSICYCDNRIFIAGGIDNNIKNKMYEIVIF